jgi:type II secretory pathway pseudopilin PulG
MGFGLIEWALALAVGVTGVAVFAGSAAQRLDKARAGRTLTDMSAILEAGQKYRTVHGVWPADIEEAGAFLSKVPTGNGWDNSYRLSHEDARFWVESDVPKGVVIPAGHWPSVLAYPSGEKTCWRMSVPLSYGVTARLMYGKK